MCIASCINSSEQVKLKYTLNGEEKGRLHFRSLEALVEDPEESLICEKNIGG